MDNDPTQFYQSLLSTDEYTQLEQVIRQPLVPSIRLNTLKITLEEAQAVWPGRYGWEIEPVPFCPAGWRITAGGQELARTPEFKLGFYYIQDAASMLPVELFSPGDDLMTLDLAAAPGGKTTHLISRSDDHGLVIANDSSASRIAPLRSNLQDWGAANVAVTNELGELWGSWFPDSFDRVLLDAPCSGQSLRTAERRKSRPVSDKERNALQAQQIRLLVSGFQALKPGGELVYATCTLHPAEDEAVLDALLQRFPDAAEVVPVTGIRAPALLKDGEQQFDLAVGNALRLWPHLYDTSGFFAALIRKRESVPVQRQPPSGRSLMDKELTPLKTADRQAFLNQLGDQFHFKLDTFLEQQKLELWERRQQILALPQLYLAYFGELPAVSAGMVVAERKGPDLIPSHELVSRFGHTFGSGRLTISLEQGQRWLQGHEIRNLETNPSLHGRVVLVEDEWGRLLGRGKVLPKRLRNLLPRRLLY